MVIGNRQWMSRNNITYVDAEVEETLKMFEERGNTVVLVAVDGKFCCWSVCYC